MMDTVMSNGSCVAEKCGQDSPKNMIGIRSIMVEQETLFKEQVQALHRLYKVQKQEMQELENKKSHLKLETAELTDGFSNVSELEDKSGALVRPVARVFKPATGSLSLHPFCSLKLFEGSGSVSFGGSFHQPEDSQSKQVRDFDLERFPEGWVDESCLVIRSDDSSPTSKESEIACVEEDYKSVKSNDTSEDCLLTTSSGKVVSSDTEGNQDSCPADPMDRKAKLSHQGSFASVNGCLNSSSSEGEENNSKMAATFKMTEGITVDKVEFPKMELSHNDQTPPSCPQCGSSEGHSKFVPGSADMQTWTLKTNSNRVEEHACDIPASEGFQSSEIIFGYPHMENYGKTDGPTPLNVEEEKEYKHENRAAGTLSGLASDKIVQQLSVPGKAETEATDIHPSSLESSKQSKRKHWNDPISTEAGVSKH